MENSPYDNISPEMWKLAGDPLENRIAQRIRARNRIERLTPADRKVIEEIRALRKINPT